MKKLATVALVTVLAGCATHANITMPTVTNVYHQAFDNKTFSYDVMYSQPKPGIFSDGEQLPLAPLAEAQLSVASTKTLRALPNYIFAQLPASAKRGEVGNSDYTVHVELTANDKLGPVYADYESLKNLGKSMITIGLGAKEYDLVADFKVVYKLINNNKTIYHNEYIVNEKVDHELGLGEGFGLLDEFTGQLFEKHLMLTLNDFFTQAAKKI
ncbi:hypothetical protein [Thalassotalea maritima]|uniref:hypothetical protein n=1 Tax=Thalassotalea maritima TaxID=3242416 RepID=UPI003527B6E9